MSSGSSSEERKQELSLEFERVEKECDEIMHEQASPEIQQKLAENQKRKDEEDDRINALSKCEKQEKVIERWKKEASDKADEVVNVIAALDEAKAKIEKLLEQIDANETKYRETIKEKENRINELQSDYDRAIIERDEAAGIQKIYLNAVMDIGRIVNDGKNTREHKNDAVFNAITEIVHGVNSKSTIDIEFPINHEEISQKDFLDISDAIASDATDSSHTPDDVGNAPEDAKKPTSVAEIAEATEEDEEETDIYKIVKDAIEKKTITEKPFNTIKEAFDSNKFRKSGSGLTDIEWTRYVISLRNLDFDTYRDTLRQ